MLNTLEPVACSGVLPAAAPQHQQASLHTPVLLLLDSVGLGLHRDNMLLAAVSQTTGVALGAGWLLAMKAFQASHRQQQVRCWLVLGVRVGLEPAQAE